MRHLDTPTYPIHVATCTVWRQWNGMAGKYETCPHECFSKGAMLTTGNYYTHGGCG